MYIRTYLTLYIGYVPTGDQLSRHQCLPCNPPDVEGDRSGFDEVVATVVGVGVPLLPTIVGIRITWIILLLYMYTLLVK